MSQKTIDVITYSGMINAGGYEQMCDVLKRRKSEKVLLVLATPGGDPHAGFRIARALQHTYDSFDALVPRYCKSAGTLVLLGASTLYLDDMSELGPLDIQVKKNDEIVGRNSGLDIIQAVNYLQSQAMQSFSRNLVELVRDAQLSTKVASEIASKLTIGLLEPIAAQIDPMKLAEMQRATEIAYEYGTRLALKSRNLRADGITRLVTGYPSHAFTIDRKEAKEIFIQVVKPEGLLSQLSEGLRSSCAQFIDLPQARVEISTFPNLLQGPAHEATSDPGSSASSTAPSERQNGGNSQTDPSFPSDAPEADDGPAAPCSQESNPSGAGSGSSDEPNPVAHR